MSDNPHSPLQTQDQFTNEEKRAKYLEGGIGTNLDKLRSISRFIGRQEFAKILAYKKLFMETSGLAGSIVECGVYYGGGLMTYANLSAALEPYNYQCKILGFDTFNGNESISELDLKYETVDFKKHTYDVDSYDDLIHCIELFNENRPLSHLNKISLIRGDLLATASKYVEENPEIIFRIIHLAVNLYKPTMAAIVNFYPRLSKGGILAIHGLNHTPGATKALYDAMDELGLELPVIKACEFYPNITYLVK